MTTTLRISALSALLLVTLLLGASFAATAEEEANRQLDFARTELAGGQADRALKSAESALRLCPSCYDAMVVKALAYEAKVAQRLVGEGQPGPAAVLPRVPPPPAGPASVGSGPRNRRGGGQPGR